MVLSDKERAELHQALVEYLEKHGFAEATAALQRELAARETARRFEDIDCALERRWNTLRRLALLNQQLETQVKQLKVDLAEAMDPAKRASKGKTLLPTDVVVATFAGHRDAVSAIAFHPFEPLAYSVADDATVRSWDLESLQPQGVLRLSDNATSLSVEPTEGQMLVVGCADQSARILSTFQQPGGGGSSSAALSVIMTLHGHNDKVSAVCWIGDQAKTVVTGARDGEVKVWDAARGALKFSLSVGIWVRSLSVSSGAAASPVLAVGGGDEAAQLWSLGSSRAQLRYLSGHTNVIEAVAFSSLDADVALTEAYGTPEAKALVKDAMRKRDETGSWPASFEPGRYVATASRDKNISVFDVASGVAVLTLEAHQNWVRAVAFAPGGKHIVSASDDGTVKVFDLLTKRLVRTVAAHSHFVCSLAVHPTGRPLMLTGSADNSLKLWRCS